MRFVSLYEGTQTYGGHHGMVKAEVSAMYLYVKAHQGLSAASEAKKRVGIRFSPRDFREPGPADILIFILPSPKLRENTLLLFSATQFVILCYSNSRTLI